MPHFNFSDSYKTSVEAGANFHATHKTWSGKGTIQYKDHLKLLIDKYNVKTVLDFGCGKGIQYSRHNLDKELNITVTQYDPCIHGLDQWPVGNFDMVIALDCIGRVSISDLPWLYETFSNWANKCVLIATQIGDNPKSDKMNVGNCIESESDLMPTEFTKYKNPDFFLMNNFSFILKP